MVVAVVWLISTLTVGCCGCGCCVGVFYLSYWLCGCGLFIPLLLVVVVVVVAVVWVLSHHLDWST